MGQEEPAGQQQSEPGPNEVYCIECGSIIKERAELCPECGVRQPVPNAQQPARQPQGGQAATSGPSQQRINELQNIAETDGGTAMIVGFLLTPVAYVLVGKYGLALVNLLTFNYFLLGPIIVPFHVRNIIRDAREELEQIEQGGAPR
jgi:hypothetical protein